MNIKNLNITKLYIIFHIRFNYIYINFKKESSNLKQFQF